MPLKGYKQTEHHKENLRKSNVGKPHYSLRGKMPKNLSSLNSNKFGSGNPMFGKKLSDKHRRMIGEAQRGEKHWNWQGGISVKNKTERQIMMHTFEYKNWRRLVFDRDNYVCVACGNKSSARNRLTLNADHIKPWAYFPELRYEISNGRTLCQLCHTKTESYGRKKSKIKHES